MALRPIRLVGSPVLHRPTRAVTLPELSRPHGATVTDDVGEKMPLCDAVRSLHAVLGDFRARNGFGGGIAANQIGLPIAVVAVCLPWPPKARCLHGNACPFASVPDVPLERTTFSTTLVNPTLRYLSRKDDTSGVADGSRPHPGHSAPLTSGGDVMTVWDDCFSFPDVLVCVNRHRRVLLEFSDGRHLVADAPSAATTGDGVETATAAQATDEEAAGVSSESDSGDESGERTEALARPQHRCVWDVSAACDAELLQHEVDHLNGITSFARLAAPARVATMAATGVSTDVAAVVPRVVFVTDEARYRGLVDFSPS